MLSIEQQKLLNDLVNSLDSKQKIWLAGYFEGLARSADNDTPVISPDNIELEQNIQLPVTILYGSRSGNSEMVAKQAADKFITGGLQVRTVDMNDYKSKDLKEEKNLIVVVSTHGEGVPPVAAEEFYEFVHSKRAPKLEGVNFAVCALGDTSYEFFCKTGADFDRRFEELGAVRALDRVDCDVDFEDVAEEWIGKVYEAFKNNTNGNVRIKEKSITDSVSVSKSRYGKKNPFPALVMEKILLSGRGSAKENYHIELSLEGSGYNFKPGDAIGIYPTNSGKLVDELIATRGYNPDVIINNGVGNKSLREILMNHYEISVLTKEVVNKYSELAKNKQLLKLVGDADMLRKYSYGRDMLDLVSDFPADVAPEDMVGILRKLQPRLYSISSSLKAYPDEVHITVGAVRYTAHSRDKEGVCSVFLADRIMLDQTLPVYIDANTNFKLPENNDAPIIMIGPGTGIAPFRSFIQEREATGATGKNWLFFGDQHFTTDFMYQTEWQKYLKNGLLTHLDVAFSRDADKKVYVQHKMLENAREIYSWLQEGAHFYVCGDMENMAPDVHHALVKIVEEQGSMAHDAAHDYVREMQKTHRYQEDVY